MKIHGNFLGGNIQVLQMTDNVIDLDNELRDTPRDWFYWAFCVEGAAGKTLTFRFNRNLVGYYGPAVSRDLQSWHWLESAEGNTAFTYHFGEDEDRVYFAHDMLYHPQRFLDFAAAHGLTVETLCISPKGRPVPMVRFGSGSRTIILTARHHACEATGNYVLEGVLERLLEKPVEDSQTLCIPFVDLDGVVDGDQGKNRSPHDHYEDYIEDAQIFCVPFVDYDGVVDGDQGKDRAPYDHNRDYRDDQESVYPEVAAIRRLQKEYGAYICVDFHSPWHVGGQHDTVFIVQNSADMMPQFTRFGKLLEESLTPDALQYRMENDYPPETGWNQSSTPCFANYMRRHGADLAFTLENTYFGKPDNRFTQERGVQLGRCFADAMKKYAGR